MSLPPYPSGPGQGGGEGRPPIPAMPQQPAYPQPSYPPQPQSMPQQLAQPSILAPQPKPRRGITWWQGVMVGVAALLSIALPVSGGLYYGANARLIADRQSVAAYAPSDNISSLVKRADMNDVGTFIFYTSHPELNTASEFNTACGIRPEQFLLGCYTGKTIHLYDVTEERLDGLREVTAAHEMLHAAFDRLDKKSQDRLGVLLEKAYEKHGDDPELAARMDAYAVSQPGTRITELHSIVGTEFADLDPELENYYKRYFGDRSIVVGLHATYMKVFTDLKQKTTDLSNQVLALADEIDLDTTTFNTDQTQLNTDIDAFIAKNQSYGYSGNQAAFDIDKAALIARNSELETRRTTINAKKTQLGDLQQQLRDLDADAQALNRSIDSTVIPGESI